MIEPSKLKVTVLKCSSSSVHAIIYAIQPICFTLTSLALPQIFGGPVAWYLRIYLRLKRKTANDNIMAKQ